MSPDQLELIKLLGLSAIFLFQLNRVYNDAQSAHAEVMTELKAIRDNQLSVQQRLTALETVLSLHSAPTPPSTP